MTPGLEFAACIGTAWQSTPDLLLRTMLMGGLMLVAAWALSRPYFPGRHGFAVLLGVMTLWLLATTVEHAAVDPPCKTTIALAAWPVILAQPVCWALFLHQYVDTHTSLPRRSAVLAVALGGTALAAAALSNGLHGLLYGPGTGIGPPELGVPRMRYERGPLFLALAAWCYAWLLAALLVLVRAWRNAAPPERRQWSMFLVVMAVPIASNIAFLGLGWRPLGGDPTPLSFGAALIGMAWLIGRDQLFTAVPLARRLLFAELPDPVLVLDRLGLVRDANRAAERLAARPPPPGRPLREWPRFGAALAATLEGPPPRQLRLDDPPRIYAVAQRALGSGAAALGQLVQLRDVTAQQLAQQRIVQVLAERNAQLSQVAELQRELRDQALRDPLTALHNRRALAERFDIERQHHLATGQPLALAVLDIDHFKRINDRHGHAGGDAVLCGLARALRERLRAGDGIFRIGGEEFALLLPGADAAHAMRCVDALREQVRAAVAGPEGEMVGFSAGVAVMGDAASSLDQLLGAADGALYRAKAEGRGRSLLAE